MQYIGAGKIQFRARAASLCEAMNLRQYAWGSGTAARRASSWDNIQLQSELVQISAVYVYSFLRLLFALLFTMTAVLN